MCIVIDTNTLASVFKKNSANHSEFKPVLNWIIAGKGKIVFGGTKYLSELKGDYLKLFLQFKKAGKAIHIQDSSVDAEEVTVSAMIIHGNFDDQHLVALLRVSGCKLVCSLDSRAYPFFRHNTFFYPAVTRPKIYSSSSNSGLLCDKNIAEICKPCGHTTREQKNIIGKLEIAKG